MVYPIWKKQPWNVKFARIKKLVISSLEEREAVSSGPHRNMAHALFLFTVGLLIRYSTKRRSADAMIPHVVLGYNITTRY